MSDQREVAPAHPVLTVLYRNHRGEVGPRRIQILAVYPGCNKWYPDRQYLVQVWDLDKQAERTFAFRHVLCWDYRPE